MALPADGGRWAVAWRGHGTRAMAPHMVPRVSPCQCLVTRHTDDFLLVLEIWISSERFNKFEDLDVHFVGLGKYTREPRTEPKYPRTGTERPKISF